MSKEEFNLETFGDTKPKTSTSYRIVMLAIWVAAFMGLFYIGYLGVKKFAPQVLPSSSSSVKMNKGPAPATAVGNLFSGGNKDVINVCVVTWGGYAGGQYFNRGFEPNPNSEFVKRYGLKVKFTEINKFPDSRAAWKNNECQLLWVTADAFVTEAENLEKAGLNPRFIFQVDWSRGGDSIVSTANIRTMSDLIGKKMAVPFATPSHTFALRMMSSAGIKAGQVELISTEGAIEAAKVFQTGSAAAGVTWAPEDEASVKVVPGSKILVSTKQATHIIADGFLVKKEYLEANRAALINLVEGWLHGNAEINTNPAAKAEAVKILVVGYGVPPDEAESMINRVRLTTIGDNRQFFGLDTGGLVSADALFTQSAMLYREYGHTDLVPSVPQWRRYSDLSIVSGLKMRGPQDAAEGGVELPKVASPTTAPAIASKSLSVSFETGSAILSDEAKAVIARGFVPDAMASQGVLIRVEGNTDARGSVAVNVALSEKRGQAVAAYLRSLGVAANRLIVVGNGPNKPLCVEMTESCFAQNRRTEFALVK